MKKIVLLLSVLVILASCANDLGRDSAVNTYLDSEIASRLAKILDKTKNAAHKPPVDVSALDRRLKDLCDAINVYDSSEGVAEKADLYFGKLSDTLGIARKSLIYISAVKSKPEIIVAIKKNELMVLDNILLQAH